MNDTISTTSTTANSVTMSHAQLASIASLAACASTDSITPVISGIELSVAPGVIRAAATNRYVVGTVEFVSESVTSEFSTLLPVKPLKQFVAASKLTGRFNTDVERITINVEDNVITFSDLNTGSTLTTSALHGNFPPVAKLFPEISEDAAEVAPYGISAKLLATLSKIDVIGDSEPAWQVQHTTGTGKPAPVLYYNEGNGRSYRFLIQPRLKLR